MECDKEIDYDPLECRLRCQYCICCTLDNWNEASKYEVDDLKRCVCGHVVTQNSVEDFKVLVEAYGSEDDKRRIKNLCQEEDLNWQDPSADGTALIAKSIMVSNDEDQNGLVICVIVRLVMLLIVAKIFAFAHLFLFGYSYFSELSTLAFEVLITEQGNYILIRISQEFPLLIYFWILYKLEASILDHDIPICLHLVLKLNFGITTRELCDYGFIYFVIVYCFIKYTGSPIFYLYLLLSFLIILTKLVVFVSNKITYLILGKEYLMHCIREY
ncbi:unnamed protein product [Moneuplotes crassus]|uniref:Uncharacterized protein n=1 Tax=Euplotes crassus TaxID=5936 RepID=A0AAD2D2A2_EUPCR|nr:unnamed protein product [Moneuplotes crassus]